MNFVLHHGKSSSNLLLLRVISLIILCGSLFGCSTNYIREKFVERSWFKDFNKSRPDNRAPNSAKQKSAYKKCVDLVHIEQYRAAVKQCDIVTRQQPRHYEAHNFTGQAYFQLGNFQSALRSFGRALSIKQNFTKALVNRGKTYSRLRQHQRALSDYSRALNGNPYFIEAYYQRALTYVALRKPRLALVNFDKTLEIDPIHVDALFKRAKINAGSGKRNSALIDYNKIIEVDPYNPVVRYERGLLLAKGGRCAEAKKDLTETIKARFNLKNSHYWRGNCAKKLGKKWTFI